MLRPPPAGCAREPHARPARAKLSQALQVIDDLLPLGSVLDPGERHLGPGDRAARIEQVAVEIGLVPDQARFFQLVAVIEAVDVAGPGIPDAGERRADAVLAR